jgi:uncharacterized membrane protein (UPF0127 family)
VYFEAHRDSVKKTMLGMLIQGAWGVNKRFKAMGLFLLSLNASVLADVPVVYRDVILPGNRTIHAEVAQTPEARQRGLMFREQLLPGSGMLFIFTQPHPHRFWMKHCKIPLDILWLNEKREIVHIVEAAPPCPADPCPQYGPTHQAALYVLEVAAGVSKKAHLKVGMPLRFTP